MSVLERVLLHMLTHRVKDWYWFCFSNFFELLSMLIYNTPSTLGHVRPSDSEIRLFLPVDTSMSHTLCAPSRHTYRLCFSIKHMLLQTPIFSICILDHFTIQISLSCAVQSTEHSCPSIFYYVCLGAEPAYGTDNAALNSLSYSLHSWKTHCVQLE